MEQPRLDVFQVIADPSRREILHLLSKSNLTINALAENFDMSRPAVSKHVKVLHSTGFIDIKDIGRERHCIIQQDGFKELHKWLAYYDEFWGHKLKKLETLLKERMSKNE